jgi:hypothetical protein
MYRRTGRLTDLHAVGSRQALQLVADHDYLAMSYALIGNWSAAQYWQERMPRDFPKAPHRLYVDSMVPAWRGRTEEAADSRRVLMRAGSTSRRRLASSSSGTAHFAPARASTPRRLPCWSPWLTRIRSRARSRAPG